MSEQTTLGGLIHTYQKYDPVSFPSPLADPPDMVSAAMNHMLMYGEMEEFSEEELANAIEIDASQIAGLMPNLNNIRRQLLARKAKILSTYETSQVHRLARQNVQDLSKQMKPPGKIAKDFQKAIRQEQIVDIDNLYYPASREDKEFAKQLVKLSDQMGKKYQIDMLVSKYTFTGNTRMDVDQAIDIKNELEEIDQLLKELEEARKNAKLARINMDRLAEYAEQEDLDKLRETIAQMNEYYKNLAEQQGLEKTDKGYRLTPKAVKLFQGKVLASIFSELQAGRTGRHTGAIEGEGAVERTATKEYEFGDSVAHMDIPQTMINAMLRQGAERPIRLKQEDIVIHRTKNNPKAATCVLMDMSGSMRGLYFNVKRMALALDGLIRKEYPGDYLQFIEMFTFAHPVHISDVPKLLPKPVTIHNPVVRLRADMSNPNFSELDIPPHFTNIQHALKQARQFLASKDTPNRQIVLITDGMPTAHFEGEQLFMLYPPDSRTETATLREAKLCQKEGITINLFLLSSWSQTEEDIRFAYRLAETTKGRVFFVNGKELDRFVVWDYLKRKRSIISG